MIKQFIKRIKRRENSVSRTLYNTFTSLRKFNMPSIKIFHLPLFYLITFFKNSIITLKHKFYDEPVFKAQCVKVGKGLKLPDGLPYIIGDLKIIIGDNVTIHRTTLGATHVLDNPVLEIGSNSTIGYGTTISVGKKVSIGNHVLIGANCYIADNDNHPINPEKRKKYYPVDKKDINEVSIGNNCWLGYNVVVLKKANIGENSMIGAHSVVTKAIPENCIAVGYPARVVKTNIHLAE